MAKTKKTEPIKKEEQTEETGVNDTEGQPTASVTEENVSWEQMVENAIMDRKREIDKVMEAVLNLRESMADMSCTSKSLEDSFGKLEEQVMRNHTRINTVEIDVNRLGNPGYELRDKSSVKQIPTKVTLNVKGKQVETEYYKK